MDAHIKTKMRTSTVMHTLLTHDVTNTLTSAMRFPPPPATSILAAAGSARHAQPALASRAGTLTLRP
eukprot:4236335-Pleurochrysis_carterae.AAC.2